MVNMYDRVCRQCGMTFKGGPRAWYCPSCREFRIKEANARFRSKGRKADRPIGSIDKCVICGKEYIVNAARQKYCQTCAPEQIKEIDCKQGSEYYVANKEDINLYRIMTRYTERACVVCGKLFKSKSGMKNTCSQECQRIRRNQKHRELMQRNKLK